VYLFLRRFDYEILEQFDTCNIRITAVFGNIVFDQFSVPVYLLDESRLQYSRDPRKVHNVRFNNATHLFPFKYRKVLCSVIFNLLLQLGKERYERIIVFWNIWYQTREHMNDKYLVIIRHEAGFLVENHQKVWNIRQELADHRIFTLTVVARKDLQRLSFQKLYFICKLCQGYPVMCTVYVTQALERMNTSQVRDQMNTMAVSTRKKLFWIPRQAVNYAKLNRSIKLPFDERNLNRDPSQLFYQFIEDLISRSNASRKLDLYMFTHESYEFNFTRYNNYVPDETDDFNFVTCATSDTFWSIAELFQRPFQPLVWSSLGITLLTTVIILGVFKLLKFELSASKCIRCILLNLVEIGVSWSAGGVGMRNLKIILSSWLLMSIVLTNSYKGLIIAYLSVPWAPYQDYEYFEQVKVELQI